jgi:hypothetical protein
VRSWVSSLRAALWAARALDRARRHLRSQGTAHLVLPTPPRVRESAVRGVHAILRRGFATCLERALVLQGWDAAHGRRRDVVIGVAGSSANFRAHAWLDGEELGSGEIYRELSRVRAP